MDANLDLGPRAVEGLRVTRSDSGRSDWGGAAEQHEGERKRMSRAMQVCSECGGRVELEQASGVEGIFDALYAAREACCPAPKRSRRTALWAFALAVGGIMAVALIVWDPGAIPRTVGIVALAAGLYLLGTGLQGLYYGRRLKRSEFAIHWDEPLVVGSSHSGPWFMHLAFPRAAERSLCGEAVEETQIPISQWAGNSHPSNHWCPKCDRMRANLAGLEALSGTALGFAEGMDASASAVR